MIRKLVFGFSVVALAVVSAATSYRVELFDKATVGGNELKAGEYKVEVKENKAIFSQGKRSVEAPVKVETNSTKYSSTSLKLDQGAIQEIRLGGTTTKLVFGD